MTSRGGAQKGEGELRRWHGDPITVQARLLVNTRGVAPNMQLLADIRHLFGAKTVPAHIWPTHTPPPIPNLLGAFEFGKIAGSLERRRANRRLRKPIIGPLGRSGFEKEPGPVHGFTVPGYDLRGSERPPGGGGSVVGVRGEWRGRVTR